MDITLDGTPFKLLGDKPLIKVGDAARDAWLMNDKLEEVHLDKFFDRLCVISTFPSLDTPTCDTQCRTLMSTYAGRKDLYLVSISEDLPFAQQRWCLNLHFDNTIVLSDYVDHNFGYTYGLFIDKLHLLARSVIVIKNKKVVYFELVKEQDDQVNFDALEKAIDEYLK